MLSKSCQYGVRAVIYLAKYSDKNNKIGVTEIAQALQVPRHFLAKILQQLARQRLISSAKGPSGGFYLSDSNIKNKLVDIIYCIDSPDIFTKCALGLTECSPEQPCAIHDGIVPFRNSFLSYISSESIEHFILKDQKFVTYKLKS